MSSERDVRKKFEAFCNRRNTDEIPFTRVASLMEKLRLHNVSTSHFLAALDTLGYTVEQNPDGTGVVRVR